LLLIVQLLIIQLLIIQLLIVQLLIVQLATSLTGYDLCMQLSIDNFIHKK